MLPATCNSSITLTQRSDQGQGKSERSSKNGIIASVAHLYQNRKGKLTLAAGTL